MQKGFLDSKDKIWEIPVKDRLGKNLILTKRRGSVIPKGKSAQDRLWFNIDRLVWGRQSDYSDKVIFIEELNWEHDKRKELRFGYRTLSHKKGTWHWGQYALIAPLSDVQELLSYAVKKGMIIL